MKPKSLYTIAIGILFVFLVKSSFAQYPGMAQFRAQQNLQFVSQQMNMQMLAMQNMRGVTVGGMENNFEVTMLDSSKKEVTSAIYTDSATKKHFIVYIDKKYKKTDTNRYKKIYPSQTLSLVCVLVPKDDDNNTSGEYVPGIRTDSCWMFKMISGRISVYSYLVKNQNFPILPATFVGLQLNDGPIIQFNEANLKPMIAEDNDAMESLQKKNYVKAIKRYICKGY